MVFVCLSTGCLSDILSGIDYDKPILQVLGTKYIPGGSGRYRLLVSDGKYSISHAMLASQLNYVANDNKLTDNTIIRVEKYIISPVSQDKKVMVILDLTVLHSGPEVGKIGEPTPLNDANMQKKPGASIQPFSPNQPTSNFIPAPAIEPNTPSPSCVTISPRVTTPSTSSTLITFISNLTPYGSKWVIRARVTAKSNIRKWSNTKSTGQLFSVDLQDESGEIRATCFNEQAEQFFDIIQIDKVYDISKGRLKAANKQYSTIKNDYEITFNYDTTVTEYDGANVTIPKVTYNIVALSEIENMDVNAIVDVAGICQHVGEIVEITAKASGREFKKREVTLVDNSLTSATVTLWGQDAETFDSRFPNDVIFIKGGKVHEFGGEKSISVTGGSTMRINPDISEAHRLRGWYDNEGHNQNYSSVSSRTVATNSTTEWLSFYEATERKLGSSEKPDYFQCKGTIHFIKYKPCTYKACPKPDCNKKVVDQDNGLFHCEKCKLDSQDFQYKIILNVSLADWTTNRWVTIFSDQAEKLLEASSAEVGRASEKNDDELNTIISKVLFKTYNFQLRTKMERYGDAARNQIHVMNISLLNYKDYNRYLVKNIQALTGIGRNENSQ